MPDDPNSSDDQADESAIPASPTAAELAGTIFANVADYSNENGGGELITDAAIGGGDG